MDAVRLMVEQAFADVPYPGDENIAYPNDMDHLQFILKGKHWKEVAPGKRVGSHWERNKFVVMEEIYLGLYMLRPEAFAFYLPVWLIAAMDYYEYGELGDTTIRALSPTFWRDHDRFTQHISQICPEQSCAIHAVLAFLDKYDIYSSEHIKDALAFWKEKGKCEGRI